MLGDADVMVAGGAEAAVNRLGLPVLLQREPCLPILTRHQPRRLGLGTKIETVLLWEKVLASWLLRSWSTQREGGSNLWRVSRIRSIW